MTNNDILTYLNRRYPLSLQLSFDNAGFLVGNLEDETKKVMLALDVTSEVITEAADKGCSLIISHHPVIWESMKQLCDNNIQQHIVRLLVKNDISVISFHTNLDIAENGVNDVLIKLLGASCDEALDSENCGRIGYLTCGELSLGEFLVKCKNALSTNGLRYYDAGRPVHKIAVMGGSGGSELETAYQKGCDTYITADIKYDRFLAARELGINLIDGDHFCTENPVIFMLREELSSQFPTVDFMISESHNQTAKFI